MRMFDENDNPLSERRLTPMWHLRHQGTRASGRPPCIKNVQQIRFRKLHLLFLTLSKLRNRSNNYRLMRKKPDSTMNLAILRPFQSFFHKLHKYLLQNKGSDYHFEVLNKSES